DRPADAYRARARLADRAHAGGEAEGLDRRAGRHWPRAGRDRAATRDAEADRAKTARGGENRGIPAHRAAGPRKGRRKGEATPKKHPFTPSTTTRTTRRTPAA